MYGNLAPEGSVAKITGKEGLVFKGTAKVYDSEELMMAGLERKEIKPGMVVVIRYEGPKGGPGNNINNIIHQLILILILY